MKYHHLVLVSDIFVHEYVHDLQVYYYMYLKNWMSYVDLNLVVALFFIQYD